MAGQFYAWYEEGQEIGKNPNTVYDAMSLAKLPLPAVIRLVDGPIPPPAENYFTPLLQMDAVYSEATLIAGEMNMFNISIEASFAYGYSVKKNLFMLHAFIKFYI